jgi:hypothetical protein
MRTWNGHFDGKVIVLDEPANLEPNTKVKILALAEPRHPVSEDFSIMAEASFAKIWDNPLDADYDTL